MNGGQLRNKLAMGLVTLGLMTLALPVMAEVAIPLVDWTNGKFAPEGHKEVLFSGTLPDSIVGLTCQVEANGSNNESVHPGNDLVFESGGQAITFPNVERAMNVVTPGSGAITLGETGVATLIMGPDGIFSAALVLRFDCQGVTTTTVATTTTPPTTTPPPDSSTTTPGPGPTTTGPGNGTLPPPDATPPTSPTQATLPFTGLVEDAEVWAALAAVLGIGGVALLTFNRRGEEDHEGTE